MYCLGDAYANSGDAEKALISYKKALGIDRKINYESGIGQILEKICLIHLYNKNIEEAYDCINEALELNRKMNNAGRIAANLCIKGLIHKKAGKNEEALRCFNEALTIHKNIGHMLSIALTEKRSEERRVGKECRSRWSPYH